MEKTHSNRYMALKKQHGFEAAMSPGSNRSQWKAMDLQMGSAATAMRAQGWRQTMAPTSTGAAGRRAEEDMQTKGLSARNILIRRKLMERKRFDSADYAMKKSKCESGEADFFMDVDSGNQTDEQSATLETEAKLSIQATGREALNARPYSPAHVGASVFFNALDDSVDVSSSAKSSVGQAKSPSMAKYGQLGGKPTDGGAAAAISARNVLLQKKLREKKHFDSADYQLAQYRSPSGTSLSSTEDSSNASAENKSSKDLEPTPMEIDDEGSAEPKTEAFSSGSGSNLSPSGPSVKASVAHQRSHIDPNKYAGMSGANVLLARKLSEKKKFDSADYNMDARVAERQVGSALPRTPQHAGITTEPTISPPPVPTQVAPGNPGSTSKYGKLCAANVLIRKKLKERKRFDSADYSMECHAKSQGQEQSDGAPAAEQSRAVESAPLNDKSLHQGAMNTIVRNASGMNFSTRAQQMQAKNDQPAGGWTKYGAIASGATLPRSLTLSSNSRDAQLAARNIMIKRKLTERKRFDSADYFSAKEGQSSQSGV